ncbi:hypothetical protein HT585_10980 [Ensifer sp. HO-A22]|uniref:Uncharacterized protein n=1 Tax=Ensifer oleiphilus TaxID=2742698 RepID=A0A7Y6Q5E6_9HYPH|nr:hypothetical protein [Ensifer oleiphilus]NVD39382.1 hypothetical protein [Ensifer oleiphilus]
MQAHLRPTPIIATARFLKEHNLPPINRFDAATRMQVLRAALQPGSMLLRTPDGDVLNGPALMVIAFELVRLPIADRQSITRMMMIVTAAAHGHRGDPAVARKLASPEAMSRFRRLIEQASGSSAGGVGLFLEEKQTEDPTAALMRAIDTGSLPSKKNGGGSPVLLGRR